MGWEWGQCQGDGVKMLLHPHHSLFPGLKTHKQQPVITRSPLSSQSSAEIGAATWQTQQNVT